MGLALPLVSLVLLSVNVSCLPGPDPGAYFFSKTVWVKEKGASSPDLVWTNVKKASSPDLKIGEIIKRLGLGMGQGIGIGIRMERYLQSQEMTV